MADKVVYLTEEGYKRLEEELNHKKSVTRIEVAARLKAAIALGDLSENSEYDDAKNQQAFLEGDIATLEEKLRNARIIGADKTGAAGTITLGSTVTIKDLDDDFQDTYSIVGSTEADPDEGRISNESPVGAAIIGHKVGEIVEIIVAGNVIRYEIVDVQS